MWKGNNPEYVYSDTEELNEYLTTREVVKLVKEKCIQWGEYNVVLKKLFSEVGIRRIYDKSVIEFCLSRVLKDIYNTK